MFHFFPKDYKKMQPFPGITSYRIHGDKVILAYNQFQPNIKSPGVHSHNTQEQLMIVLKGGGAFTVGEESHILKPMDGLFIPPKVMHGAAIGPDGCEIIEIFSPPEDN